jgi:hypothetical protein
MIEKSYPQDDRAYRGHFLPHCAQTRCAIFGAPQFLQTIKRSFFIAKWDRRRPTLP